MIALVVFAIFVLFLIKTSFAISRFIETQNQLSTVPGPQCELVNGNLNLFSRQTQKLSSEVFYNTLKAIARLYQNEGIFKLRFGNKFIVCVSQKKHLKAIISSTLNIDKSVEYNFLDEWLGDGLLLASSKNWFPKRSLLAKAFHAENFPHFTLALNYLADSFVPKMACSGYLNCEKTFHFTVDAIAGTLLGCRLTDSEIQTYLECIHKMTKMFTTRALSPLLWNDYLFKMSKSGKIYRKNLQILKGISKRLVMSTHTRFLQEHETQAKGKPARKDSMLDMLWRLNSSLDEETLDAVCKEVDTFLFAGHDTTALSLNWIFYYLGRYPDEQAKLRDEIAGKFGPRETIQLHQLDCLLPLDSFIQECLRLHPPVPLIGRQISKAFTIGEHTIPSGTMLYILIDQLHLDEQAFPSPCRFEPNRFLERPLTHTYMPFAAGPRSCIGKRFALVLIKVLIIKVMLRYEIHSEETLDQIEMTYNIVLKPKRPLKIRLTEIAQHGESFLA